jgi:cholesterol transport system auxiliary component
MMLARRLLIATLGLSLGACAALSGKHGNFAIYAPQLTGKAATPAAAALDWQLQVDLPRASSALDSTRIAVMPTRGVLEVYADARWRDPAPAMLRSLIIESFERDGRIAGVSASDSGLSGDYALAIELRDFQIEIGTGGEAAATIRLTAKLFDRRSNRIVASQSFDEAAAAAGSDRASALPAFEEAINALLPRIVEWTVGKGKARESGMGNGAS